MDTKDITQAELDRRHNLSKGWSHTYRKLSSGVWNQSDVEYLIEHESGPPLPGWNEGMRIALEDWLEEQELKGAQQ